MKLVHKGPPKLDSVRNEISVTPLVDVCLVLLIIFMVLVPRNVPEISVRVPPESKQRQKPPTEEPLVIGLSSEGAITLNKNPIDKSKLAETIGPSTTTEARLFELLSPDELHSLSALVERIYQGAVNHLGIEATQPVES